VRAGWQVIADVARAAGHDLEVLSGPMASAKLFAAVPFFHGLTLDIIGGRGVRWPETEAGQAWSAAWEPTKLSVPDAGVGGDPIDGRLRLGTFRTLWASKEVDASPSLKFLRARQIVELSPEDAAALGVREGDRVEVGSNGTRVQGPVKLRAAVPGGSVFLAEATHEQPVNVLTEPLVEVRRIGTEPRTPSAVPAMVQPAAEGLAEAPASAPQDIPPVGPDTMTGGGKG
jgi:NADH-quinone oxidoreductase subunit G